MRTALLNGSFHSDKQPTGLKLTSMSGEQTVIEVTKSGSTRRNRTFPIDFSCINYIMGMGKPATIF